LKRDTIRIADLKENEPDANADSTITQAHNYIKTILTGPGDQADTDSTILSDILNEEKANADELSDELQKAQTVIEKNDAAYLRKSVLGDDPYVNNHKGYGNANTFPYEKHGTACAGIIAALRNNGLGGNGITNSVVIMPLKIAGKGYGDEWDKDVVNAIRYAADNGAKVINMSFGKYFSPQQGWVKDAISYAARKGVLLVHAAGNDAVNDDSANLYPLEYYADKDKAPNLITVGASTYDSTLVADFSNYGAHQVDVFAPGVDFYVPGTDSGYLRGSGTSFASPMVAGLAAFIWSYYPQFTYRQIRYCIEQSATSIALAVTKPGTHTKVPFSSLSRTGGIINAYKAMEIAEKISKNK